MNAPTRIKQTNMHFARFLPGWNSLDSARAVHSDLELAALVFFALLVLFDVLAHLSDDKNRERRFERIGLWFFGIAVIAELLAYPYGQRNDDLSAQVIGSLDTKAQNAADNASKALTDSKDAETKSGDAVDKAGKANLSSSNAIALARGARKEADSFERDIKSANNTAIAAEQHLKEALNDAAEAQAELNRLRSPRSLIDESGLIAALLPFKGTEYTISVFQDDESIQLTKELGQVLDSAGWIRKEPSQHMLGLTYLNVFDQEFKDSVPVCVATGIEIDAQITESAEAVQLAAPQNRPKSARAAGALWSALRQRVSPFDKGNLGRGVGIKMVRAEGPVEICVGKKP